MIRISAFPCRVSPLSPVVIGEKVRYTLRHRTNMVISKNNNLMLLDWEGSRSINENLAMQKDHTLGFELRTFLLQGNTAFNFSTMEPHYFI